MNIKIFNDDIPDNIDFGSSIAIDTETMGLNFNRDRLCLIQISTAKQECFLVKFNNDFTAPNLRKLLADDKIQKIFHFARFDMAVIFLNLKIRFSNVYCTKIASKLVRTYTDSHGLKNLCEELLSIEISKKQQSSDWGNQKLSDKQIDYACSDVIYLHSLKNKLEEMITRENRETLLKECLNFLPTRVELDLNGFQNVDIFSHS